MRFQKIIDYIKITLCVDHVLSLRPDLDREKARQILYALYNDSMLANIEHMIEQKAEQLFPKNVKNDTNKVNQHHHLANCGLRGE